MRKALLLSFALVTVALAETVPLIYMTGGGSGGGSGSGGETETAITVSNPIGKYKVGDIIPVGTKYDVILQNMLAQTFYPALTNPSLRLTYAWPYPEVARVGRYAMPTNGVTLVFDRGSITPQYSSASPYRSGEAVQYRLGTAGATLAWSSSNDTGVFSVPPFMRDTKGIVQLQAQVDYAQGAQPKDSDGNNYKTPLPSGTEYAVANIEFILPFFFGVSTNAAVTGFAGFGEVIKKKGTQTMPYATANNQYLYFAYDRAYGFLTSITDQHGMEHINGWQFGFVTYEGQEYVYYRSPYAITGDDLIFTFSFEH